eukprot:8421629-Alexandrium_andersonii.AAC.1
MSASLVGSEMCIRDRVPLGLSLQVQSRISVRPHAEVDTVVPGAALAARSCLLYTSDAADDM